MEEYNIKIVLTLRNYAKQSVMGDIQKYFEVNEIVLCKFQDKEIKEILQKNLDIHDEEILEKIINVSKGNIRLAILAGLKVIDGYLQDIQNVEDIFQKYYSNVFERTELEKKDLIFLFWVSFLGPVRYREHEYMPCNIFNDEGCENIIEKLYSYELIDWFKNEIIKISDQSFGNYILYYIIYEKKWISIHDVLKACFPQYKKKIIYMLNTLLELFASEELIEYMETEVNLAWDLKENYEKDYIESFYMLNLEKSLLYLRDFVQKMEKVDYDLQAFEFNKYNTTLQLF